MKGRHVSGDGYPVKLVRDRIRDLDSVHDGTVQIWAVGLTTRNQLLRKKLMEEVAEYLIDGGEEELADVLEVVECLATCVEGSSFREIREIQKRKRKERGGFARGHVMFCYPAEDPQPEQCGGSGEGRDG